MKAKVKARMKRSPVFFIIILFASLNAPSALGKTEDPTGGKPFFPWLWEEQFRPTLENAASHGNLSILAAGGAATIIAHQYDSDVYNHNLRGQDLLMSQDSTEFFAALGSGAAGVGLAITQIVFDTKNGLLHSRAITLTAASHVLSAFIVGRSRPGGRGDYLPFKSSFPSGHSSSAFATAGSLAYSYGWIVGVPAFAVASAISAARVSENAHWLSDVVAGAALGVFWARASHLAEEEARSQITWMPIPIEDGMLLSLRKEF